MRVARVLGATALVVGLAGALAGYGLRRLEFQRPQAAPLTYFVVQAAQAARFSVLAGEPLRLLVRVPRLPGAEAPARYGLTVRVLAADGAEVARHVVARPARHTLLADVVASAPDTFTLVPAAGAAWLELAPVGSPLAVRVARPVALPASRAHAAAAAGAELRWLTPEEARRLVPWRTEALPVLGALPTLTLPPLPPAPDAPPEAPVAPPRTIDARRSVVFNLAGPGRAEVRVDGAGTFDVELVGGAGGVASLPAGEARTVEVPAGVASLVIAARGDAVGVPAVILAGARSLDAGALDAAAAAPAGPIATAAAHRSPAFALAPDQPLVVPVRGGVPVRVVARALGDGAPGDLLVEELDEAGAVLGRPQLLHPSDAPDRFTLAEYGAPGAPGARREPLRAPTGLYLQPGPRTRQLRVRGGTPAIVTVEARVDDGADGSPAAPYDAAPPPGLRFFDEPSRAPTWFVVYPLGPRPTLAAAWALVRAPRLVPRGGGAPQRTVEVLPVVAGPPRALRERAVDGDQVGEVDLETGGRAQAFVSDEGLAAGRVALRCGALGALGGEVRLLVDGVPAARARLRTEQFQLDAAAAPGVHRVELEGAPARCVVPVRGDQPGATVVRRVFPVDPRAGLRLALPRPGLAPTWISCAVYGALGAAAVDVEAIVDGGRPRARPGVARQLTAGRRRRRVPVADVGAVLAAADGAAPAAPVRRVVARVAIGDDLAAGVHEIVLRPAIPGPAWARCWTPGARPRVEQVSSWTTIEE